MRQQEKMIQDMEKAVYRRETIIFKYVVNKITEHCISSGFFSKKKILQKQII